MNRDSISKNTLKRPSVAELKAQNVLPGYFYWFESFGLISPVIAEKSKQLEKQIVVDKLEKKTSSRPAKEELINQGILRNDNIASSLLANKIELEKQQVQDNLRKSLSRRPSAVELQQ